MKKLTKNQKLWKEQRQDLYVRIMKLKSQGVDITPDIIPQPPEYISKSSFVTLNKVKEKVEKLEIDISDSKSAITKQNRNMVKRRNAVAMDDIVRKVRAHNNIPNMSQLTMNWLMDNLDNANTKASAMLKEFVEKLIDEYGYLTTANMIYNLGQRGITISEEIIYDSDGYKASQYISQVTEFISDTDVYSEMEDFIHELFDAYDTQNYMDMLHYED